MSRSLAVSSPIPQVIEHRDQSGERRPWRLARVPVGICVRDAATARLCLKAGEKWEKTQDCLRSDGPVIKRHVSEVGLMVQRPSG